MPGIDFEGGPKHFVQLVDERGSGDGREVALKLERLRTAGRVDRLADGEWHLSGD